MIPTAEYVSMSFEHLSCALPIRLTRPIRTEADLQQAFARLHDIFQAAAGTAEADERDVWVALIEAYESEHYPFGPGDPVEAIKFRLDQEGLTPRDLEPFIGPSGRVSEVLNRKRPLSLRVIKRLHEGLKIPYETLLAALDTRWLAREIPQAWASCPLTRNGCIGIMSQPAYPGSIPAAEVAARLAEAAANPEYRFWPDDVRFLVTGVIHWPHLLGHRQVTDNCLPAQAARHRGRFVTLDRRTSVGGAAGAKAEHLALLH